MALLVTAPTILVGFLFGRYWKSTFIGGGASGSTEPSGEKRRISRVKSDLPFELGDEFGGFNFNRAELVDLSLGGLCFASATPLEQGDRIEGRLHASKDSILHVSGRVVWLTRQETRTLYGLAFQTVTERRS